MHIARCNVENSQKTMTGRILYSKKGGVQHGGLIAKGGYTCMRHNCHLQFKRIQKVDQDIKTIDTCHK